MSERDEPEIIVNGERLSEGQAMTVRVALTSYHSDTSKPNALGRDEHGRAMAKAYFERASEVLKIMFRRRTP